MGAEEGVIREMHQREERQLPSRRGTEAQPTGVDPCDLTLHETAWSQPSPAFGLGAGRGRGIKLETEEELFLHGAAPEHSARQRLPWPEHGRRIAHKLGGAQLGPRHKPGDFAKKVHHKARRLDGRDDAEMVGAGQGLGVVGQERLVRAQQALLACEEETPLVRRHVEHTTLDLCTRSELPPGLLQSGVGHVRLGAHTVKASRHSNHHPIVAETFHDPLYDIADANVREAHVGLLQDGLLEADNGHPVNPVEVDDATGVAGSWAVSLAEAVRSLVRDEWQWSKATQLLA